MISDTGFGLSVVIYGDYSRHNSWKSFSSYISVKRIFPDSHFVIALPNVTKNPQYYRWLTKSDLKRVSFHKEILEKENQTEILSGLAEKPCLVLRDEWLLLRTPTFKEKSTSFEKTLGFFDGGERSGWISEMCCDSKKEDCVPFVKVEGDLGNYNEEKWKKINIPPFYSVAKIKEFQNLGYNEHMILNFWNSLTTIFTLIG